MSTRPIVVHAFEETERGRRPAGGCPAGRAGGYPGRTAAQVRSAAGRAARARSAASAPAPASPGVSEARGGGAREGQAGAALGGPARRRE
ncbi:hypothetical protein GCM10009544_52040 [Streptomyces stramineus]|uniref:Uncharacterized protein n=1 Tax=Streptomyces stramineus TaxID=173861 RepID=A0ABP3KNU8_9ACTN